MRLITRHLILVLASLSLLAGTAARPLSVDANTPVPPRIHILPPPHVTPLVPSAPPANVTYHGGPVVHAGTVYAIYWLPTGVSTSTNYQPLINRYFTDIANTPFFRIVVQYPDTSGSPTLQSNAGTWLDTTAYPRAGTLADPLLDGDIQAEVAHAIALNPSWHPPGPNTEYFVFTGRNVLSCLDGTKTVCYQVQYCAYHGSFVSGSATVLYANMPDAGTDLTKCATGPAGPNGDPDADAEISLASHEHFEMVTNPLTDVNTAWIDAMSLEIGDKCAWDYGALSFDNGNLTLQGHRYKVQQEWSNAISGCALAFPGQSLGGIDREPQLAGTGASLPRRRSPTRYLPAGAVGVALVLVTAAAWLAYRRRTAPN